jgi:hypothetical protein
MTLRMADVKEHGGVAVANLHQVEERLALPLLGHGLGVVETVPAHRARPHARASRHREDGQKQNGASQSPVPSGASAPEPGGVGFLTMRSPMSFRYRWKSGESSMMVPAAARRRSTASGESTNEVGSSLR